ncbi:MAG: peroxiredoxin [Myxococcales bacterium]|nr:peroxiredoxin [Myxococcales bacterium]
MTSTPRPQVGQRAPDFTAVTESGTVSLATFLGKKLVLYFYPKDDTPGCTIEARGFRDHHDALAAKNAVVLGVSKDTVKKHGSWKAKECLPFSLVADSAEDPARLCEKYGAWRMKKLYGREYMGIARITVIIDEGGFVTHVIDPVKANGHAQEILALLGG